MYAITKCLGCDEFNREIYMKASIQAASPAATGQRKKIRVLSK